ncbi:hypothetical protein BJV82DRAFT_240522 [Fennellomyces sp. T-0311]|nr:hypothetical protein BJV82DRAFT_240522 [Fennellomyces sp. T-0311]
MNDESVNRCLASLPVALNFLQAAMEQELSSLPRWLWTQCLQGTKEELAIIHLMQLTLTDFYANCTRPEPVPPVNERTPFVEHVIPVIKYFNSVYEKLHIQWGEKDFDANRFIGICLPTEGEFPRKLMDDIGISTTDKRTEYLAIESSGEIDDDHTAEDTLKIIECSIQCLQFDMANHKKASFATFLRRKVLGLQYVGNRLSLVSTGILDANRWSCVLVRSAVIPRTWRERWNWQKVFELLIKMNVSIKKRKSVSI